MISISRQDCRPLSLRTAADLLQALGHPIRLQILHVLRAGPVGVGEIVARLSLQQPVVSRHLAILRDNGVVRCRTQGRERHYQLDGCRIEPLLEVLFEDSNDTPSNDTPSNDTPSNDTPSKDTPPKDATNRGQAA